MFHAMPQRAQAGIAIALNGQ
ncbi:hypothetical protein PT2222_220026 [Paraburkholderia tropica]